MAQKLNVAHILEGSVRKSGNKVRITAQLIKAADGYHLWSETYDRTLDDIFVVQDDIAGEVVKALKLTLLGTALSDTFQATGPGGVQPRLAGTFLPRAAQPQGPRTCSRLLPAVTRARSRLRAGLGGPVAGIRTAGRQRFRAGRGRLSTGARGRGEGAGARSTAR